LSEVAYGDNKLKIIKQRKLVTDMAIFHMSFQNISAGKMRSAVASAAYRSGEKLLDEKENRSYFYARSVMPESFILTPNNAPEWANDRVRLWNEVEKKDRKSNSRYAKEFNVALPVELSNEEQKELLTKYVQENFVDQGMVADVAIHRDHPDNPHAHVMLTNRPFNSDGTWGIKSKKQYILDENGNKTYTKSGYARNRKIWLTDWDKKEKINEWRHNWAVSVNMVLEAKKLPDRISEKSYLEQGINEVPTKHIGINSKRHERASFNQQVKELKKLNAQYNNVKEKLGHKRHLDMLSKHFSFNEKKLVKELSHELKTFVNLETIDDKRRMLFNWKNSLLIKHAVGEDITKQLLMVSQEENSLKKADQLLNTVTDRTVKKLYPELDFEATSMAERRELIKETNSEETVFKGAELAERLAAIREDLLTQQILLFTKRPYVSWKFLLNSEENGKKVLEQVLKTQGNTLEDLSHAKRGILEEYTPKQQQLIARKIKEIRTIAQIKQVVKTQYQAILQRAFPNGELDKLSITKQEQAYTVVMYYSPGVKPFNRQDLKRWQTEAPVIFNSTEHQQGLACLSGEIALDQLKNKHLQLVLRHDGTRQLFIGECQTDKTIEKCQIVQAQQKVNEQREKADQYRGQQLNNYQPTNYKPLKPEQFLAVTFSNAIMQALYAKNEEIDKKQKGLKETEWEMTKKQRQHQTRNRHEGGGLHM
jgi:hypothetical protein